MSLLCLLWNILLLARTLQQLDMRQQQEKISLIQSSIIDVSYEWVLADKNQSTLFITLIFNINDLAISLMILYVKIKTYGKHEDSTCVQLLRPTQIERYQPARSTSPWHSLLIAYDLLSTTIIFLLLSKASNLSVCFKPPTDASL